MDFNIIFTAVSAIIAVIAFVFSIISFFRTVPDIDIEIDNCIYMNAVVGFHTDEMEFKNIFLQPEDVCSQLYFITIKVINPRNHPISIFNISATDGNNNKLTYYKNVHVPHLNERDKLVVKTSDNTFIGCNLPYSDYKTINPGEFCYVNIVIPDTEINRYNSRTIKLFFRDSTKSFLNNKNKRFNLKSKYPIHYKEFNISK